ncbi:MAG: nicotinamide riboside transporter PnuC [Gammaproteobacteria bacterium]|nr:nicotinamide riboside transporter PnuC [Gammaproteobacteria bacterium]
MYFTLKHDLEIPAMIAGFLNIYLAARANIWNWLFGIVSVTIYAIVFYEAKLYGDMCLQGVYLIFQFYGWNQWMRGGKNATALSVTHIPKSLYLISSMVLIILYGIFVYLLSHDTNSTTPIIDAFTTALSLVAQWMMCKKYLENWLLWIVVDIISVYMYWYKHLYLTSGLYAVFFILCCMGYQVWKRSAPSRPNANI